MKLAAFPQPWVQALDWKTAPVTSDRSIVHLMSNQCLVSKPLHLCHGLLASGDSNRTLTKGPVTFLINTMLPVLAAVKVLASTWIFPEDTMTPRGGGDGPPKGHKEARCFTTTNTGRSPSHVQKVTAARLLSPPSSQTAATKKHVARPPAPCCNPPLTAGLEGHP